MWSPQEDKGNSKIQKSHDKVIKHNQDHKHGSKERSDKTKRWTKTKWDREKTQSMLQTRGGGGVKKYQLGYKDHGKERSELRQSDTKKGN